MDKIITLIDKLKKEKEIAKIDEEVQKYETFKEKEKLA